MVSRICQLILFWTEKKKMKKEKSGIVTSCTWMSSHADSMLIVYEMQCADASQPSIFTPLSFCQICYHGHCGIIVALDSSEF